MDQKYTDAMNVAIVGMDSLVGAWNSVQDLTVFFTDNAVTADNNSVIDGGLKFVQKFKADLKKAYIATGDIKPKTAENRICEFIGGTPSRIEDGLACGYRESKFVPKPRKPGTPTTGKWIDIPADAVKMQRVRGGYKYKNKAGRIVK